MPKATKSKPKKLSTVRNPNTVSKLSNRRERTATTGKLNPLSSSSKALGGKPIQLIANRKNKDGTTSNSMERSEFDKKYNNLKERERATLLRSKNKQRGSAEGRGNNRIVFAAPVLQNISLSAGDVGGLSKNTATKKESAAEILYELDRFEERIGNAENPVATSKGGGKAINNGGLKPSNPFDALSAFDMDETENHRYVRERTGFKIELQSSILSTAASLADPDPDL